MKKLSLLIAVLLLVTIGGVYATWSYAGTDDIADAYEETKVVITDAVLAGSNGVYDIESNLVLYVDQANDKHETKLLYEAADSSKPISIKVTFTPAEHASQEIKNNAIPSEFYFTTTTDMTYSIDADGNYSATGTPTKILKFKNYSDNDFIPNVTWTKQADGSFVYELDAEAIKNQIQLNQIFVLDTKAEHDAFRASLNGNIMARITDGTVN